MEKFKMNIDGKEVFGLPGQTILQVAEENGIKIPTLCYDERTEIYGSCGLCVVEVEGNPKLCKACATKIADNMSVKTKTQRVLELRKMNLELLLSNHRGDCRPPCMLACPAETDCQGYVGLIANGQYEEAIALIKEKLPLPASIGRVCPHPCEDNCRRGLIEEPVSIAWLKRFAADSDLFGTDPFLPEIAADTGKKIAVIGGGPYGLSVAYFLRTKGHSVTIFEAMPKLGGMLRYGIPEYRLPKKVLDEEIALIQRMGVTIKPNTKIGKAGSGETDADEIISFDQIRKDFDAVCVGIGAWKSTPVGCKGDDAKGVVGGIDLLRQVVKGDKPELGKVVAVVGGGNTAMDACRTAIRLGAEKVYNVYRRTKDEMPAEEVEIVEAEEEGVIFKTLVSPLEIIADENGNAKQMVLQVMELGEPGPDGRRKPIAIEGKTETIDVDTIVAAIGQAVASEDLAVNACAGGAGSAAGTDAEGISLTRKSAIAYDPDTFRTSMEGVFAGGDCGNDKISIAIEAIGDARKSAIVVDEYLQGKEIAYKQDYTVQRTDITYETFEDRERACRPKMAHLSPEDRKQNFEEIVKGYTPQQAQAEGQRCLECGCHDYFECKLIDFTHEMGLDEVRFETAMEGADWEDDHEFVVRDNHKCILCGLCVRVCDEVVGAGALGFVHRGFQTVVEPALEKSLRESGCVSCGQCIDICPTGALGEKMHACKSVPLDTEETKTTCSYCSAGCELIVEHKGDLVLKVKRNPEQTSNNGVICGLGKFGFDMAMGDDRLKAALIKKNGKQVEASYNEAVSLAAQQIKDIIAKHGKESVGVSISDRLTNEDIATVKSLADQLGAEAFCFNYKDSGLAKVTGIDVSTAKFDDLDAADAVVVYGPVESLAIRAKLRKAAKEGAKIAVVIPESMQDKDVSFAQQVTYVKDDLAFMKGVAKAVVEAGSGTGAAGTQAAEIGGFQAFADSVKGVALEGAAVVGAKAVADLYQNKKVITLFQQNNLTVGAAVLAADIAAAAGKVSGEGSGIIQIKAKNNSQGLVDQGVETGAEAAAGKKALLIFGEAPAALDTAGLEFLLVSDVYLTDAGKAADVVIPQSWLLTEEGTFTNTEGSVSEVQQVFEAGQGCCYSAGKLAASLADAMGVKISEGTAVQPADACVEKITLTAVADGAFAEAPIMTDDMMLRMKDRLAKA